MHVHLIVPDLFLPAAVAAEGLSGLRLSALERLLARSEASSLESASLESWLCAAFGAEGVAPVTLLADGMQPGDAYWLRADPVHLMLRGGEVILHPVTALKAEEAGQMCDSLNRHFAGEGLHFAAPRPQHWYVRLESAPALFTHSLAQAAGRDIRPYLPRGADVVRWHGLLNEIQMLLTAHPVNAAREARGEWIINSIWPWGGGHAPAALRHPFSRVYGDSEIAAAFARSAGLMPLPLPSEGAGWREGQHGPVLIVWDGLRHALQLGDLGEWRDSIRRLEEHIARPALNDVRYGRIERFTLDVMPGHALEQNQATRRFTLARSGAWGLWRLPKGLGHYSA